MPTVSLRVAAGVLVVVGALPLAAADPEATSYERLDHWLVIPEANVTGSASRWRIHPMAMAMGGGSSQRDRFGTHDTLNGLVLAGVGLRRPSIGHHALDADLRVGMRDDSKRDPSWRGRGAGGWTLADAQKGHRLQAEIERIATTLEATDAGPERTIAKAVDSFWWQGARTWLGGAVMGSWESHREGVRWLAPREADHRSLGMRLEARREVSGRVAMAALVEATRRDVIRSASRLTDGHHAVATVGLRLGMTERIQVAADAGLSRWAFDRGHGDDPSGRRQWWRSHANLTATWAYRDPEEGYVQVRVQQEAIPGLGALVTDATTAGLAVIHHLPRRFVLRSEAAWYRTQDRSGGLARPAERQERPFIELEPGYLPTEGWRTWIVLRWAGLHARVEDDRNTWSATAATGIVW